VSLSYVVENCIEVLSFHTYIIYLVKRMTCRGEFSFIIAAFALSEGVIEPKMYAAVVWAVLLSATTSPFILLNAIEYFKGLQDKHLELTNVRTPFS